MTAAPHRGPGVVGVPMGSTRSNGKRADAARHGSKTVLMVDYYFPPLAGAAVHRTLGYARHLAEFGWNPVVLTAEAGEHNFYDPSLLHWVPPGLPVRRTPSIEPVRFAKHVLMRSAGEQKAKSAGADPGQRHILGPLAWLRSWILFPDRRIGWFPFAVSAAAHLRRRFPFDVIYSTSTAVTSHLIAYALKALWRKPWVADFQDPWTEEYDSTFPSPLHRRMALTLERLIIRRADRVTVTTGPMKEIFRRKHATAPADKFQVIPMGFHPQALMDIHGAPQHKFTITHFGNFYGTRSPGPFLQALAMCEQRNPAVRGEIDVRFFGGFDPKMRAIADTLVKEYRLERIVQVLPPVTYRDGLQQLKNSDVLLLVTDPGGNGQHLVPSKLFEYFAVGRPILALAPEGAVAELMREARAGVVVRPDDVSTISDAVLRLFGQWREGTLTRSLNEEFISTCTWRARTAQFAAVLEAAAGDRTRAEGSR